MLLADRESFLIIDETPAASLNFETDKNIAAVQSIMRVGGLTMKGVFTRTRQPKVAAHVLREFWVKGGK